MTRSRYLFLVFIVLRTISVVQGQPTQASHERYALLIGVDRYSSPNLVLDGPDRDLDLMKRTLVDQAGFKGSHVRIMSNLPGSIARPTTANIVHQLNDLRTWVPPSALLVVMFSGHGFSYNGVSYLLGADADFSDITSRRLGSISSEVLKDRINKTQAGQVVILLDTCRDSSSPLASKAELDTVLGDDKTVQLRAPHLLAYSAELSAQSRTNPATHTGFFSEAVVRFMKPMQVGPPTTWGAFVTDLKTEPSHPVKSIELSTGAESILMPTPASGARTQIADDERPSIQQVATGACSAFDIMDDPCKCDPVLTRPASQKDIEVLKCETLGPQSKDENSFQDSTQLKIGEEDLSYRENNLDWHGGADESTKGPLNIPDGYEVRAVGTGAWRLDSILLDQDKLKVYATCKAARKIPYGHYACSVTYEVIEHHIPQ